MKRMVVSANHAVAFIDGEQMVTLTEEEFKNAITAYNKALTREELRKLEEKRIEETGILEELNFG